MPMQAKEIEDLLRESFPNAKIQVEGEDGVHMAAMVVDESFRGKNRVQQQRAVYAALKGKMDGSRSYQAAGRPKGPYLNYLHRHGLAATYVREHGERQQYRDAYVTALPEEAYCDNWIAENGLSFLRAFDRDRPWHLVVNFTGPQKLRIGVDELTVAGALGGSPVNVVKAKTVDLEVPAEAEIIIEGLIDTEYLEPEGPFGESHGYVALEEYNFSMEVTIKQIEHSAKSKLKKQLKLRE